tara:strand:- start:12923 stop:13642 length:720 start_codon:yes stop_codon:yes gene_type:complete
MDVLRDQAIAELEANNVRILRVNLQATNDRFEVRDLTRTDVAQSQARLALAEGRLETAQAQLDASKENFLRVVDSPPIDLQPPPPLPRDGCGCGCPEYSFSEQSLDAGPLRHLARRRKGTEQGRGLRYPRCSRNTASATLRRRQFRLQQLSRDARQHRSRPNFLTSPTNRDDRLERDHSALSGRRSRRARSPRASAFKPDARADRRGRANGGGGHEVRILSLFRHHRGDPFIRGRGSGQ